jgi:hypothetical protein
MTKHEATTLSHAYHVQLRKDFDALSPPEVERVLEAADAWKYRKPKNANGSRGRYFYALLNRAANRLA